MAVCAEMVLAYLSAAFTRAQLISALRIQPNVGTPFRTITELEKLGILVGYRPYGTLETLYTLLTQGWPVIASVFTGPLPYWDKGTGHAVVVVGMDSEHIFVNDPVYRKAPSKCCSVTLTWPGSSRANSTPCLRQCNVRGPSR